MPICIALAAGEGLASLGCNYAEMWPLPALISLMIALFGYGFSVAGWKEAFTFFVGISLFLSSCVESERELKDSPWLRGQRRYVANRDNGLEIKKNFSYCAGLGLDHRRDIAFINRAILLGERSYLPKKARKAFTDSGAIHVFAVSGLHVMIVAGVIKVLLGLLFIPYRYVGVAAVPILWGYVALIGSPPSAVRAAVMASFYFAAPLFYRRSDSLRAWELAFLAIHVCNPSAIANIGSILSFLVMLSLVVVNRAMRDEKSELKKTLVLTVSAWAAGLPVAAQVFGRITPGGILSNLFLFAVAGYSVGAGIVGMLAGFVSESLSSHINNFSGLFTDAMVGVAYAVSSIPGSNFEVPKWGWVESVEWYAAMILIGWLVYSTGKRRNLV